MNSKQTTVTINQSTSKKLERLAVTNGISKKDFIDQALNYFEKYGINPTQDETPVKEMDRIRKRQDQVVAFLKTQEKNILEPSLLGIAKADESMRVRLHEFKSILESLTSKELTNKQTQALGEYIKNVGNQVITASKDYNASLARMLENHIKLQNNHQQKVEQSLVAIAQYLDKKGKEGLLDKVSSLLK